LGRQHVRPARLSLRQRPSGAAPASCPLILLRILTPPPSQLTVTDKPTFVAAGSFHSALLFDTGVVRTFGNNEFGQLGTDSPLTHSCDPTAVALLQRVIHVALGALHSIVIDMRGQVIAFGSNRFGQLGVTLPSSFARCPIRVASLAPSFCVRAACGYAFSLILTGTAPPHLRV
jgi:hypothetical protein